MKTTTSTEEVSSHPVEKGRCEPKKHRNSPVPENNRNGLDKKFLQIYGAGRKSRKRPTLVVGKKPYGKCQMKGFLQFRMLALVVAGLMLCACLRAGAQGFGLSVTGSANSIIVSNSLTYTINVTNLNQTLTTTFVTNLLPASVQFQSANPTGTYTNYGSVVVFNLGAYFGGVGFQNGQSAQLTLTVQPTVAGFITNMITVASFEVTNTASTNVVVQVTNAPIITADLGVAVTGPRQPVITNDWVTYGVIASNAGPITATGVTLTNTLPAGVILLGAVPANYTAAGSNLIFNLGTLAAGGYTNFQFAIQPTNAGPLTLSASIGSAVLDTNLANNSASTNITVTNYFPRCWWPSPIPRRPSICKTGWRNSPFC